MKPYYLIILIAFCTASCNDWLNVTPETETEAKEMFTTPAGFKDALTGCYIKLNDVSLYGQNLTMTNIEYLAQHWNLDATTYKEELKFKDFDYTTDYSRSTIQTIYAGLYNTIVQANIILENLPTGNEVITDPDIRAIIEGEALAIRAFCHLDIFRLFGQLPQNATIQVSLPYAEKASLEAIPYYNFTDFTNLLLRDLDAAEALFKAHDPLLTYSFAALDKPNTTDLNDSFLGYRRFRFNYYATLALKARLYLYLGNHAKANEYANQVIQATDKTGSPMLSLAGKDDFSAGNFTLPSECILALSSFQISQNVEDLFSTNQLNISESNFTNGLFSGPSISSNRVQYLWGVNSTKRILKKYDQPSSTNKISSNELATQKQVIPLIRLSEMYLIAIETTPSVTEANSLYATYMAARNVNASVLTKDQLDQEIVKEYRREFFAEGQMFYTYKRLESKQMLWKTDREITEKDYILPLPGTEVKPE